MSAICTSLEKEALPSHVRTVKDAIEAARDAQRRKHLPGELLVPGFCLPKALGPLLPIYLQGLLSGSTPEAREMAAEALGELVAVTSQEALRPFVVQITGPLIRTVGDRFAPEVKAAILGALGLLVQKGGVGLKPFVPQLQTSFLKCLHDGAKPVRDRAAGNLGRLAAMSLRVDQLALDLASSALSLDRTVGEAFLVALRGLLLAAGPRLKADTLAKVRCALLAPAVCSCCVLLAALVTSLVPIV